MNTTARAALLASAAAAMAATGWALVPAGPASAASTAEFTIAQLEAQGFDVRSAASAAQRWTGAK